MRSSVSKPAGPDTQAYSGLGAPDAFGAATESLGQPGDDLITAGLYAARQLVDRVAPMAATP